MQHQAGHSPSSSGRRSRLTEAQKRAREERRLAKARERHRRYRNRLSQRRAPELRDIAMIMLDAWCAVAKLDQDTMAITAEFRRRCALAGFDEEECKARLRAVRKKIVADRQIAVDKG